MEQFDCAYCGETQDLPFECNYCNDKFCAEHRLPESHRCVKLIPNKSKEIWRKKDPKEKGNRQTEFHQENFWKVWLVQCFLWIKF